MIECNYKELKEKFDILNVRFENLSKNSIGDLLLYVKTDYDKVSIFKSKNIKDKYYYLNLSKDKKDSMIFELIKEVNMDELKIFIAITKSSSDYTPDAYYTIEHLEECVKNQEKEQVETSEFEINGFAYTVFDDEISMPLFSEVYEFGSGGFMNDIKNRILPKYDNENQELAENVRKVIDYYSRLKENEVEIG